MGIGEHPTTFLTRRVQRFIAIFLTISFTLCNNFYAQPTGGEDLFVDSHRQDVPRGGLTLPEHTSIALPPELGTVTERYVPDPRSTMQDASDRSQETTREATPSPFLLSPSKGERIEVRGSQHAERSPQDAAPRIFYIQDAHGIPGAQRSIWKLIEHLQQKHGVQQIAVEGAAGKMDPTLYRAYPEAEELQKVVLDYWAKAELSGAPVAAILNEAEASYYGIEDIRLYFEGVRHFLEALRYKPALLEEIKAREADVASEKKKFYSKELLSLDTTLKSWHEKSIDLTGLLEALASYAEPTSYPAVFAVSSEIQKEKIALPREVSEQIDLLLGEVKKLPLTKEDQMRLNGKIQAYQTERLDAPGFAHFLLDLASKHELDPRSKTQDPGRRSSTNGIPSLGGEGMEERVNSLREPHPHLYPPASQGEEVSDGRRAQSSGPSAPSNFFPGSWILDPGSSLADRFPALLKLSENVSKLESMQGPQFFRELEAYIGEIKQGLFKTDKQREIDREDSKLALLRKLASLELSRKEWDQIKARSLLSPSGDHLFSVSPKSSSLPLGESLPAGKAGVRVRGATFTSTLPSIPSPPREGTAVREAALNTETRAAGEVEVSDPRYSPALRFYENAAARESAMVENLLKLIEAEGGPIALITGGFHTDGITERLKQLGVSYVLVQPKMSKIPQETRYLDLMLGNVSWRDHFHVVDGKVNLYEAFARAIVERLLTPGNSDEDKARARHLLKSWRDEIIRYLARKGEITRAGDYTRFLDEAAIRLISPEELEALKAEWQAKLERFLAGLKDLMTRGQLTEDNLLKLFKEASGITAVATMPLDPDLYVSVTDIPGKIPVQGPTTAPPGVTSTITTFLDTVSPALPTTIVIPRADLRAAPEAPSAPSEAASSPAEGTRFFSRDTVVRLLIYGLYGAMVAFIFASLANGVSQLLLLLLLTIAPSLRFAEREDERHKALMQRLHEAFGVVSDRIQRRIEAIRKADLLPVIAEGLGLQREEIRSVYLSGSALLGLGTRVPSDVDLVVITGGSSADQLLGKDISLPNPIVTAEGYPVSKLEILAIGENVLAGGFPRFRSERAPPWYRPIASWLGASLWSILHFRQVAITRILQGGELIYGKPVEATRAKTYFSLGRLALFFTAEVILRTTLLAPLLLFKRFRHKLSSRLASTVSLYRFLAKESVHLLRRESGLPSRGELRLPAGRQGNAPKGLCVTGDTLLPVIRLGGRSKEAEKQRGKEELEEIKKALKLPEGEVIWSIRKELERESSRELGPTSTRSPPDNQLEIESASPELIPITQVKPGDRVLSLDEATQEIEARPVLTLLDMGTKPVYRLTTASGRSIKTTVNHPYLTKVKSQKQKVKATTQNSKLRTQNSDEETAWVKVSGLRVGDEIAVPIEDFGIGSSSSYDLKSQIFPNLKERLKAKLSHSPLRRMMSRSSKIRTSARSFLKEETKPSGSFWASLSQTTAKISSRVYSMKSSSLVTKMRFSFFEREAREGSWEDFRAARTSNRFALRKRASSTRTFSSSRNRGLGVDNDVVVPRERAGVFQSRLDVLAGEGRPAFLNFFDRISRRKHLKDLPDHDSGSLKGGLPVADLRVSNNVGINHDPFHSLFPFWPIEIYHTLQAMSSLYRLTTASGRTIKTTANHPYLVKQGLSPGPKDRSLPAGRQRNLRASRLPARPAGGLRRPHGLLAMTEARAPRHEDETRWVKVSELRVGDEIAVPSSINFASEINPSHVENILLSEKLNSEVAETEPVSRGGKLDQRLGKNHRIGRSQKISQFPLDLMNHLGRESRKVLFSLPREEELISHPYKGETLPEVISRRARSYSRLISAFTSSFKGHRLSISSMSAPTGFFKAYASSDIVLKRNSSIRHRNSQKAYTSNKNHLGLLTESKLTAARNLFGSVSPRALKANLEKWSTLGLARAKDFTLRRRLFLFISLASTKLYHAWQRLSSLPESTKLRAVDEVAVPREDRLGTGWEGQFSGRVFYSGGSPNTSKRKGWRETREARLSSPSLASSFVGMAGMASLQANDKTHFKKQASYAAGDSDTSKRGPQPQGQKQRLTSPSLIPFSPHRIDEETQNSENKKRESQDDPQPIWKLLKKVAGKPHGENRLGKIPEKPRDEFLSPWVQWFHAKIQYSITFRSLAGLFFLPEAEAAEVQAPSRSHSDILWDPIVSIEYVGLERVYDIEVAGTHNFIGNGIFAHNTAVPGSLPSIDTRPTIAPVQQAGLDGRADDRRPAQAVWRAELRAKLSKAPSKAELEQATNELLSRREPWQGFGSLFEGVGVVYFGDSHSWERLKQELIQAMPQFKAQGVTHLFLEAVRQADQHLADQYLRETNSKRLAELEKQILQSIPVDFEKFGAEVPALFLGLIKAAKEEGIQVVGLGQPTVGLGTKEGTQLDNEAWGRIIRQRLQAREAGKGVVFGGASHLGYENIIGKFPTANQHVETGGFLGFSWFRRSLPGRVVNVLPREDLTPEELSGVTRRAGIQRLLVSQQPTVLENPFQIAKVRDIFPEADTIVYLPPKAATTHDTPARAELRSREEEMQNKMFSSTQEMIRYLQSQAAGTEYEIYGSILENDAGYKITAEKGYANSARITSARIVYHIHPGPNATPDPSLEDIAAFVAQENTEIEYIISSQGVIVLTKEKKEVLAGVGGWIRDGSEIYARRLGPIVDEDRGTLILKPISQRDDPAYDHPLAIRYQHYLGQLFAMIAKGLSVSFEDKWQWLAGLGISVRRIDSAGQEQNIPGTTEVSPFLQYYLKEPLESVVTKIQKTIPPYAGSFVGFEEGEWEQIKLEGLKKAIPSLKQRGASSNESQTTLGLILLIGEHLLSRQRYTHFNAFYDEMQRLVAYLNQKPNQADQVLAILDMPIKELTTIANPSNDATTDTALEQAIKKLIYTMDTYLPRAEMRLPLPDQQASAGEPVAGEDATRTPVTGLPGDASDEGTRNLGGLMRPSEMNDVETLDVNALSGAGVSPGTNQLPRQPEQWPPQPKRQLQLSPTLPSSKEQVATSGKPSRTTPPLPSRLKVPTQPFEEMRNNQIHSPQGRPTGEFDDLVRNLAGHLISGTQPPRGELRKFVQTVNGKTWPDLANELSEIFGDLADRLATNPIELVTATPAFAETLAPIGKLSPELLNVLIEPGPFVGFLLQSKGAPQVTRAPEPEEGSGLVLDLGLVDLDIMPTLLAVIPNLGFLFDPRKPDQVKKRAEIERLSRAAEQPVAEGAQLRFFRRYDSTLIDSIQFDGVSSNQTNVVLPNKDLVIPRKMEEATFVVVAPEAQGILPQLIRLLNEIALRPPAVQRFLRDEFGLKADSEGFIVLNQAFLDQLSEKAWRFIERAA